MEYVASKTDSGSDRLCRTAPAIRCRVKSWIWTLMLSFLLTSFAGCGGSSQPTTLDPNKPWGGLGSKEAYMAWKEEQERKEAQEEAAEAAAAREAAQSRPPAAKSAEGEQKPDQRGQRNRTAVAVRQVADDDVASPDDAPEQDAPPPVPQPPGDLTQWQEQDYFVAKLLEKPELLEAVARSAADKRDDEAIVRILTRLLQPKVYAGLKELVFGGREDEEPPTNRRRPYSSTQRSRGDRDYSQKLIETVVDALAQNTTAAASRSLAQLVVGKLETEDNAAASKAALESLAAHPTEAHEDMLFRIAVEAERLVDAVEPAVSPEVLSRQAVALLAEGSSSAVRVRAAEYLAQNNPPPEIRSGLERLLSELTPENLEAHVILYVSAGEPKPSRQALAGHFAASSSAALEHLMGVKVHIDAEQLDRSRQTANLLWSNSFALVVEGRLNRLDSWSDEPALLALALSLPADTMRAAVARRLDVQWSRGPGLNHSQLIGGAVVEPGSLVLLRRYLGERSESWKQPSLTGLRNARTAGSRSARTLDPVAARQQQERQIQDAWANLAGDLAADWCARCRRAAHDRDAGERARGRRIDWSEGLAGLPIRPHATEGVTATHTVLWPGGAPAGATDAAADPLAVHYVRIEERTRPTRLLAYYGRALPDHRRRDIENGVCFEGMHGGAPAGVLRSIDVRITRAGTEIRRLPDEEQDLVVEILAVTIRDPAGSASSGPS